MKYTVTEQRLAKFCKGGHMVVAQPPAPRAENVLVLPMTLGIVTAADGSRSLGMVPVRG